MTVLQRTNWIRTVCASGNHHYIMAHCL